MDTFYIEMNRQSNKWFWYNNTKVNEIGLESKESAIADFFTNKEGSFDPESDWPSGYSELEQVEEYKYSFTGPAFPVEDEGENEEGEE